jgi:hypothetical protein
VDLELFNPETQTLYTLPSQTIQNIAPLELDLLELEKKANSIRNSLRKSERLKKKNAAEA